MFNNITPDITEKMLTGIKTYIPNSNLDKILAQSPGTTRRATLFGFHPDSPEHIRDLAHEVETIRQHRADAVAKLESLPNATGTTLDLKRSAKKIDDSNVHLVVEAIQSGAQYSKISRALNMSNIKLITDEARHPNASPAKKAIHNAIVTRELTKRSTRRKLQAATNN